ncbi:MAG: MetS family NSS transporter small subunit [bacterium]|nr:MetS family NSS transporter small subunit [bacterium]
MPVSAIVMLLFGCVVLYGGLMFCLYRAIKGSRKREGR